MGAPAQHATHHKCVSCTIERGEGKCNFEGWWLNTAERERGRQHRYLTYLAGKLFRRRPAAAAVEGMFDFRSHALAHVLGGCRKGARPFRRRREASVGQLSKPRWAQGVLQGWAGCELPALHWGMPLAYRATLPACLLLACLHACPRAVIGPVHQVSFTE